MNRTLKIFIILVLFLCLTIVGAANNLNEIIPLSLEDQRLRTASIIYSIATTLEKVSETPNGVELTIGKGDDKISKFLVTENTEISSRDRGSSKPASVDDLRVNQKVILNLEYNLKTQVTTLRAVTITVLEGQSSTP